MVAYQVLTAVNCEEYGLLDCNAMLFGDSPTFRSNVLTSSSGTKIERSKKLIEVCGRLSLVYYLTVKREAIRSSETSLSPYHATGRCDLEHRTIRKSYFANNFKI
jgi:hypothetical protein